VLGTAVGALVGAVVGTAVGTTVVGTGVFDPVVDEVLVAAGEAPKLQASIDSATRTEKRIKFFFTALPHA
jgi:hypothetical protein